MAADAKAIKACAGFFAAVRDNPALLDADDGALYSTAGLIARGAELGFCFDAQSLAAAFRYDFTMRLTLANGLPQAAGGR